MFKSNKSFLLSNFLGLTLLVFILGGCKDKEEVKPLPEPQPYSITVNPDVTFQTITGFGGGSRMWGTQFLNAVDAKKAFGNDDGDLGMTMFRIRIASDSAEWPFIVDAAKEAQKHGAKIFASPWSPPAQFKSNNSPIQGNLLPENYGAFKDYLNKFIAYMASQGVEIYAVSVQNEPDWLPSYESCGYDYTQMYNFVKNHAGEINAKVIAAEALGFNKAYTDPILNDADARANIDIVGGHLYGAEPSDYPLAREHGKEIWMTEHLLNLSTGEPNAAPWSSYSEGKKWTETIEMLDDIHNCMTSNFNAYVWWYIQRYYSFLGDGEQGTTRGSILRRGYAFSHFAKYIRPGYQRIEALGSGSTYVKVTGYKGDGKTVLVVINTANSLPFEATIDIPSSTSATAFATSLQLTRAEKEVTLVEGDLTVTIDPSSVTTIVIE